MAKAQWHGVTLAESDDIAHVEGNAYFPVESVKWDLLRKSGTARPTYCHWKGIATYYDIEVDGEVNEGACWIYEEPYPESALIDKHVAFWKGVDVTGAPEGRGLVEQSPSLRGDKTGWEALCWLIRNSEAKVLSAAEVEENTDIAPGDLAEAFQLFDVQRYATRYKWRLVEGEGGELRMEKTE